MNIGRFGLLLAALLALALPSITFGITLGQVDTFEDGTSQGWTSFPTNLVIPTGGPVGSSDHYLPLITVPSGGPIRLETTNKSQWLGNYLAAGVTGIEMDLKNNNIFAGALSIRIAINEDKVGSILTGYSSTAAFNLPLDGLWHHAIFSLEPESLTAISSPQLLTTDLANVVNFRIINSASPATNGDIINFGGLGIDNIRAVPEPSTICLAMSATMGLALFRRRCCKL